MTKLPALLQYFADNKTRTLSSNSGEMLRKFYTGLDHSRDIFFNTVRHTAHLKTSPAIQQSTISVFNDVEVTLSEDFKTLLFNLDGGFHIAELPAELSQQLKEEFNKPVVRKTRTNLITNEIPVFIEALKGGGFTSEGFEEVTTPEDLCNNRFTYLDYCKSFKMYDFRGESVAEFRLIDRTVSDKSIFRDSSEEVKVKLSGDLLTLATSDFVFELTLPAAWLECLSPPKPKGTHWHDLKPGDVIYSKRSSIFIKWVVEKHNDSYLQVFDRDNRRRHATRTLNELRGYHTDGYFELYEQTEYPMWKTPYKLEAGEVFQVTEGSHTTTSEVWRNHGQCLAFKPYGLPGMCADIDKLPPVVLVVEKK